MMATASASPAPKPSLREAQRRVTRDRICEAAALLFYERGFASVTMEDIAQAAGLSRSTLYVHYPDKTDLSVEIAVAYADDLCALVAQLPGPVPSRAEIERWIARLVALVIRAHVPATLILDLSARGEAPAATAIIEERLLGALGRQLPAFADGLNDNRTHARARAWAQVAMRELGWACKRGTDESEDARRARQAVAADVFEHFVQAQAVQAASVRPQPLLP